MSFSIIIPIKNQYKIVKMCLDSIVKYYLNQDVVLIDDYSTEQSTIDLLKDYSKQYNWKLFRNEQSVGHSGACTKGIEESSCENVVLLYSDTIVTYKCLQILSDVLDNNKDIAVCGPSTSSASGEQLIKELYNKRFTMTLDDIEAVAKNLENDKRIVDISLVNGCCAMLKKSVFNSIDGFDKNLNCYGNEKEIFLRIRAAGYRTVWVTNCYTHHFGKMSYSQSGINISRAQTDADQYIFKKHGRLE